MTSFSGNFTGIGQTSGILRMDRVGKRIEVALSGTYNMEIVLEKANANLFSWEEVARYSTEDATVADHYITKKKREWFRLRVSVDTSGTAAYVFNDVAADVIILRDEEQEVRARFHEDGVHFPGTVTADTAIGGGDVVEDTTPQLGGDLDVNGQSIVSATAGDIAITPHTTGDVIIDGIKWPQADGSANEVLTTDGAGQASWTAAGVSSHRGALVKLTAGESIAAATVTAVPWDAAEYDTDSIWAGGAPTRLTVPSGVTRVRLKAAGHFGAFSAAKRRLYQMTKNGLDFTGAPKIDVDSTENGTSSANIASPDLIVVATDYFEFNVFHNDSVARDLSANEFTWFAMEIIE